MMRSRQIIDGLGYEAKNIFSMIQKNGPMTKNQLLLMTNMKLTTLNRFMQPLEEGSLVIEAVIGESSGGRRPVLYDVNPSAGYIVGIDISRTYTRVVITDLKMNLLGNQQFDMTESSIPEVTVKRISECVSDLVDRLSVDKQMILGAGIGTVGPMNRDEGIITHVRNFRAPGWNDVPIKDMLEKELGLSVIIDNGANTAVLAEFFYGSGRGFESIAYFNCGIGIRTGAVFSGNIIRTINDAEDVFGHMIIDVDGELCDCGNYGCIDCYSSINSIVKKFIASLKRGRVSSISENVEDIDYMRICEGAEKGDQLAREIITNGALAFGAGLANYINLLNPGLVILSGPLIKHSEMFYKTSIESAFKKIYLREESKITFNKGGDFKDDAIAIGAAAALMEQILKENI